MSIVDERGQTRPPADERPCWLDVDLDAVAANVRGVADLVGTGTRVCAVVKANAYGLGAVEVGQAALAAGAERLAVARVDEAIQLRQAGIRAPILLLTGFAPTEADSIVKHRITPSVVDVDGAILLARAAGRAGAVLDVHIKVDTGLTRYGAPPAKVPDLVRLLRGLPTIWLEGLYSHFASADEPDRDFTAEQLHRLFAVVEELKAIGWRPSIVHAANSAAALREPTTWLHMVRLGLALSGHYPSRHVPRTVSLRPAVALRARLLGVRDVAPGTTIGYGQTFVAERPMRVGLIPAGYADGVPRSHSNRGAALVRGQRAPLVGRVSMDQCVVDITSISEARAGDVVTLFGADGVDCIGLDEFAAWSDTIVHEALCRVGARVPRRYAWRGDVRWGWVAEPLVAVRSW
jgi:alanine racemase